MKTLKLFRQFCIMSYKTVLEYKFDFYIGFLPVVLNQVIGLVFIKIVFNNIHTLTGYSFWECALIYGFFTFSSSIEKLFFGNFPQLRGYVFYGKFDLILLKPTHPILYMVLMDFDGVYILEMIIAGVIIGVSMCNLSIQINVFVILFILISVICGVLFLSSTTVLTTSLFFYTEGTFSLFNILDVLKSYVKYPISIFGKGISFFLKWILPLGIVSYFPSTLMLYGSRKEMIIYCIAGFSVTLILFIISNVVFSHCTKKYQSTGC